MRNMGLGSEGNPAINGVICMDFLVETGPLIFPIPCISLPDINGFLCVSLDYGEHYVCSRKFTIDNTKGHDHVLGFKISVMSR